MNIINKYYRTQRVLAVDPYSRGFGYAVLEGKFKLIDWGMKRTRINDPRHFLRKLEAIMDQYRPNVIVTEDYSGKGSRRCRRVQGLIDGIIRLARRKRIREYQFSRDQIRQVFAQSGSHTKYQIAVEIAYYFPELILRLPRYRKAWMPEDARMNIFDAISSALTYYLKKNP